MKLTRKLLWIAGALWAAALIAGIGFWLRPVSYLNGTMYAREAFSGVENRQVTVEGHRMHYLAEGPRSGPVVVLVHGLGGRAEDWSNLSPFFARAGFRVYMPDLFGYGRSERPRDFSYSVRDQANAVVDFMNALGLKQVNLGGWSMGGWIVQIIAASHPETVKRLMLFDSAGIYAKPDWNTNLFMPRTPGDLDQLEALLMPHPPRIPGFVARDILRISARRRWVTQRALNTMMTGKDTTDGLLPELTIPVPILWGKEDHITPLDLGKKMQQLIPRSELLVYDGCGHLAPGQCASAMGPTVAEFAQK
jgi:pimeloyl-ACP methyl ester carboxylesterase